MGRISGELSGFTIITSDNPRNEDPQAIIRQILSGMDAAAQITVEPDRRKAIHFALAHAAAGDSVVVCGKGHETTQEIKGVKYPFDDRCVCREYSNGQD